jgi:hypothetical protein
MFRVVNSRRHSEPIQSRMRSRPARNITVLQFGGCNRTVLSFAENQEPSRRRSPIPRGSCNQERRWNELRPRCSPPLALIIAHDTQLAFLAFALIFRDLQSAKVLPLDRCLRRRWHCLHNIEILITEQNPGIVFILQTIPARDVQRDLKFLQRSIKPISLGTQGHVQLLPQ